MGYGFRRFLIVFVAISLSSCQTEFDGNFCPSLTDCLTDGDTTSSSSIVYTTFYSDNFNRADENPIAAPWNFILVGGDLIEVKSNQIDMTETDAADPPGALHTTNVTATNSRLSVNATIGGAGYAGEMRVYYRSQSNGDVLNTYFCGIDPTNFKLVIGKNIAGVASPVVTSVGTMTYDNGDSYTLTFTGEGSSLTCALTGSDSLSVSATDSDFSTGYAGLAGGGNGNNVLNFDDFLVETGT